MKLDGCITFEKSAPLRQEESWRIDYLKRNSPGLSHMSHTASTSDRQCTLCNAVRNGFTSSFQRACSAMVNVLNMLTISSSSFACLHLVTGRTADAAACQRHRKGGERVRRVLESCGLQGKSRQAGRKRNEQERGFSLCAAPSLIGHEFV